MGVWRQGGMGFDKRFSGCWVRKKIVFAHETLFSCTRQTVVAWLHEKNEFSSIAREAPPILVQYDSYKARDVAREGGVLCSWTAREFSSCNHGTTVGENRFSCMTDPSFPFSNSSKNRARTPMLPCRHTPHLGFPRRRPWPTTMWSSAIRRSLWPSPSPPSSWASSLRPRRGRWLERSRLWREAGDGFYIIHRHGERRLRVHRSNWVREKRHDQVG